MEALRDRTLVPSGRISIPGFGCIISIWLEIFNVCPHWEIPSSRTTTWVLLVCGRKSMTTKELSLLLEPISALEGGEKPLRFCEMTGSTSLTQVMPNSCKCGLLRGRHRYIPNPRGYQPLRANGNGADIILPSVRGAN